VTYHESFWVTVGTVVPVIGLAHVVALNRNTGVAEKYIDQLARRIKPEREQSRRLSARLDALESDMDRLDEGRSSRKFAELRAEAVAIRAEFESQTPVMYHKWRIIRAGVLAILGDIATAISFVCCLTTLGFALASLGQERDAVTPLFGAWLTLIPAAALGLTARSEITTKQRFEKLLRSIDGAPKDG
jgi:hypothetical protein